MDTPLGYNPAQYIAPSLGLSHAFDTRGFMTHARSPVSKALRLLALAALFSFSAVHADEYGDVGQLLRSGKLAEALTRADQYLAGKPRDPQMRFLKGVIQTEAGKPADAITTFTKLTEDYPELPEPYNNLAVLYAGQSQFDKARAALEMAIRTNPSYATAHENLGDVYAKLASQAYSKALQLDSNNTGVQPKLALIRDLFAPGAKGQRPAAPAAAAPAPAVVAKAPHRHLHLSLRLRPSPRLRPPLLPLPRLAAQRPRMWKPPCAPGPPPGPPRTWVAIWAPMARSLTPRAARTARPGKKNAAPASWASRASLFV